MKKILTILIASLFWCNISFAHDEEEPKWFLCKPNKENWGVDRKPLYIKFHNTDKIYFDGMQYKWRTVKNFKANGIDLPGVIPTLEVHEDKSKFDHVIIGFRKLFPIYVSDKYYVFYQEIDDSYWWGSLGLEKAMAQHLIINRDDLTMIDYTNEWVYNLYRERKYNDEEINKLYNEVNSVILIPTEDILLPNGKTLEAERILHSFQCSEIEGIKPKI